MNKCTTKKAYILIYSMLSCILSSLISSQVYADCAESVRTIYQDVVNTNESNAKNEASSALWKDFTWLKKTFGDPSTINVVEETQYQWKNFTILLRAGKVASIQGNFPDKIPENLENLDRSFITAIIQKYGDPLAMNVAILNQYNWVCSDSRISIATLVNSAEKVVAITGTSCLEENCNTFNATQDTPFIKQGNQQILKEEE